MFDRIVVAPARTETRFVTREVHEHRAPTDDSVKLLKEFEEKAQGKVIEAITVEDNLFKCVIHTMRTAMDNRIWAKVIFDLNGHRETVDIDWPGEKARDTEDFLRKVHKEVSERIALKFLGPSIKQLTKTHF